MLLDQIISSGQLCDFLDTLEEQKREEEMWEFYIHKLPPWDERSYEEFKKDLRVGKRQEKIERPSDEFIETTIRNSYEMIKNFEIEREGG